MLKFYSSIILLAWRIPTYSATGVMGALDEEISLLKDEMVFVQVDTIAGRIFYKGGFANKAIVLVKAGVGKVNAALTAQLLIDKFNVERIIFTGIAGGINPELEPGDIVISTRLSYHDFGTLISDSFVPDSFFILADSSLVELARVSALNVQFDTIHSEITGSTTHLPSVFLGTIVTGDQFIASESKRKWLELTFDAYAVEMEGAAVAHVCLVNGLPFVVIRSVSDLANETAEIDIDKFKPYAARNSALIVKAMLSGLE